MYIPTIDAGHVLQAEVTKTATFNSPWLDLGKGFAPGRLGMLLGGVVALSAIDTTMAQRDQIASAKAQATIE